MKNFLLVLSILFTSTVVNAEIVNKHGIKFVGPSADIISKMGDKIQAKKIAKKYGLPIIEGSEGGVKNFTCV